VSIITGTSEEARIFSRTSSVQTLHLDVQDHRSRVLAPKHLERRWTVRAVSTA